jgi:hypothetical protein
LLWKGEGREEAWAKKKKRIPPSFSIGEQREYARSKLTILVFYTDLL